MLFAAELDRLATQRGLRVVHVPGSRVPGRQSWLPASAGHLGDAEALLRLVPDVAGSDVYVYVCGPDGWLSSACAAARAAGVPEAQLHVERFDW